MTKPALEQNIFMLSEKNEHERNQIERLSKLQWLSEYAMDIFETMKESEMRRRPVLFMSTQMDHRPKLLQLCQWITRTYRLSRCSLHLAIYYLDRLLDFYTIRMDKLQLIALICIHIAAQIENQDAFVPRYSEMNRLIKKCYAAFEYKAVERKVLTFFDFNLMRPTTASFVEMFACSFLTREDYEAYCQQLDEQPSLTVTYPRFNCFEQMLGALAQLLLRFSDYTLSINRLCNEPPSLLAASCIAATRQLCGIPKRWTPYLTQLTSYTEQMIEPCVDCIVTYHYCQPATEATVVTDQQQLLETSNWSSPDSGFEEQLLKPHIKIVSVEMEPFDVISVQLQGAGKRNRDEDNEDQQTKRFRLNEDEGNT
ncbi:PREDICTED: cyclin-J [Drosophila arizonae]|uniref:Cyclin-J n=1 Tax=Drosophila arizonae TaxID=7263 RepID=A0ABM1P306_DROAR|nr:PREDICTED: cyclin-J [Drosophila arizonae]